MTLFESDPQYREKATLWRIFSLGPLYRCLAGGRVFRWFAINIPMDLGTGGSFTSDIDIVARLHDYPRSREWVLRAGIVLIAGLVPSRSFTKYPLSGVCFFIVSYPLPAKMQISVRGAGLWLALDLSI